MNLAILFWFYKEPEVCENRLQLLKKYNPDLKILGLEVAVTLERPGFRIKRRKVKMTPIGKEHRLTKEDAIAFVQTLGVEVQ